MTDHYGVIGSLRDLERLIDQGPKPGAPRYLFVPKHHLAEIFTRYDRAVPVFPDLAPHARIPIDVFGFREAKGAIDILWLEASLFEDMASLWNDALQVSQLSPRTPRVEKRLDALVRATAKAAFALLEGYLNGLASSTLATRSLSESQRALLLEWDEVADRARSLKLRDKILQYPKIAAGVPHPPLTETNCPQIADIVELEVRVRHSLIHPRPPRVLRGSAELREQTYFYLTLDEVGALCDQVSQLISRIATAVGADFGSVGQWLHPRASDGLFPEEAFK